MNIYFDNLVYSLQRAGGISTYWGEISSRLLRDGHDIFFDEYIGAENVVRNQLEIPLDKLRIRNNKFLIAKRFMDFRLKEFKKPFIFHSSYNRISNNLNALNVCTIHDFVHEKFYSGLRKKLHAQQKKKAISHAKRIITVSDNTKNDLLNFFPEIDPGTIKTIYNGVSDDFYPLDPKCVITEEARPYLLFIGSREHYKNYEFCVELMAELSAFDFWIVGPALNATETSMLNAKLKNRWKISTYIDNQTLNKIYNGAFALIYPSSYEGFGIPILEAMQSGTPFLALNKSSIPEVAGNAGILVDELDIEAFKTAIHSVDAQRIDLVLRGFEQAAKFSWENCYQQTLQLYQDLYNL